MVGEFVHDLRDELEANQEHVSELLPIVEAQIDVLRAHNIRASLLQEISKQTMGDAFSGSVAIYHLLICSPRRSASPE
jgi:hypothetical protein